MQKLLHRWIVLLLLALLVVQIQVPAAQAAATVTASARSERYPVILIPGIGGTELYNHDEVVWINPWRVLASKLPIVSVFQYGWLRPLRLAQDGATPGYDGTSIRTGDIMRGSLTDAYSGMVAALERQGYIEGQDLRLFPYDWRLDPSQAVDKLGKLVEQTLRETGARQVVLLSHSLGGLIARDYVVRGGNPRVRATISMATPFLGTPTVYKALEYGWDMGLKIPGSAWSALAPRDVRLLVQNYPAVYSLAPSSRYFDFYPDGYIFRNGRGLSYRESLERAIGPHNAKLAGRVPAYQDRLLDGSDHGVRQYVLAGKGRQTLGTIAERKDWTDQTTKTERTVDGDEVVPLFSADLGYSKSPAQAQRYIGRLAAVSYVPQAHTLMAQSAAVQEIVENWLTEINGTAR